MGETRVRANGSIRHAIPRTSLRMQSDERLVALARAGSRTALEIALERYRGPLLGYSSKIVGHDRAEDVVQDTLVRASQAIQADGREMHLKAWLYQVAHNLSLNVLKRHANNYEELGEEHEGVSEPATAVEESDNLKRLVTLVKGLPSRQRDAIVLNAFEGMSVAEVARQFGSSPRNIRQLIYRGRTHLRNGLGALIPLSLLRWLLRGDGCSPTAGVGGAVAGGQAAKTVVLVVLASTLSFAGGMFVAAPSAKAPTLKQAKQAADSSPASRTRAADARFVRPSHDYVAKTDQPAVDPSTQAPNTSNGGAPQRPRRSSKSRQTNPASDSAATGGAQTTTPGESTSASAPAWQRPISLSATDGRAGGAQGVVGADGTLSATWREQVGGMWRIHFSRTGSDQPGVAETVSAAGISVSSSPQLAVDAVGNALVAWQQSDGSNTRVTAAYRPSGGSFGAAFYVSAPGENSTQFRLAGAADGHATIAWQGGTGPAARVKLASAVNGSFGAPETIAGGQVSLLEAPEMAVDDHGNALIAWWSNEVPFVPVRAAYKPAAAPVEASVDVSNPALNPYLDLTVDSVGNFLLAWQGWNGVDRHSIGTAARTAGEGFGAPIEVDYSQKNQLLSPAVAGYSHDSTIAWVEKSADGLGASRIFAAHGSGPAFSSPQKVADTHVNTTFPQVAADDNGNTVLVWSELDGNYVRAAYRPSGGTFGAPTQISPPSATAALDDLYVDGSGNGVALWTVTSSPTVSYIQASRIATRG